MIRNHLPQLWQSQMLARAHILQRNERRNGAWTPAERTEEQQLNAAWAWAQSVRHAEVAITADMKADTITTVAAVETDAWWPDPF